MEALLQYKEVEKYILEIPKFTKKNLPEDTHAFWEKLGSPGQHQKIIHVAGTNGKGSVCSYLSTLLQRCGYSTGMFVSPHLEEMTERIRIDGQNAEKEEFVLAFRTVMEKKKQMPGYHPTFFEILFFMAMLIFERRGPEYIVLETGMGGRLDATNCIPAPVMTIITRIGLDHIEYLGDTIPKIAAEKAGIIKEGAPLVCLKEPKEAYQVMGEMAKMKKVPIFAIDKRDIRNLKFHKKAIDFSYKSSYYDYIRLTLGTSAFYQVENAVLALKAFEHLKKDKPFTQEDVEKAIRACSWEGRMEEVLPDIYVDGAHNEDGVRAFLDSVSRDGCLGKRKLLFSVVNDKDYGHMIERIVQSGLFYSISVAALENKRTVKTNELYHLMEAYQNTRCYYYNNVESAFLTLAGEKEEEGRVYAAGSLYLVGQIKALLRRKLSD